MIDKIDINWNDPWFQIRKTSVEKFNSFSEVLFDIFSYTSLYKWFPEIPWEIFLNWKLKNIYSIIKKWESYFILYRWNKWWKFLETLMPFNSRQIVFSFTKYDFPNISELDFNSTPEGLATESLLNTYVYDILRSWRV